MVKSKCKKCEDTLQIIEIIHTSENMKIISYGWCYFLNLHKFAGDHAPVYMLAWLLSKHFEILWDDEGKG